MTEKTERCVERKEPIRSPDWCYMFLTPDRKWQVELADKDEGGSFYGPYETPQEATAVLLALDRGLQLSSSAAAELAEARREGVDAFWMPRVGVMSPVENLEF